MNFKRIIATVLILAFIFTQSGLGTGFVYAASNKAQNLRGEQAVDTGATGVVAKAIGDEMKQSESFKVAIAEIINPVSVNVVNANAGGATIVNRYFFQQMQDSMLTPVPEYDRDAIAKRIKPYIDPKTGRERPECRDEVQRIIHEEMSRTNRGRESSAEEAARLIAELCLEAGITVAATRHSRAFDTAAKLLANSAVVDSALLRGAILTLETKINAPIGFKDETENGKKLAEANDDALGRVAPEVIFLANLLLQKEISGAQITGGVSRLRKQTGLLRNQLLAAVEESGISSASKITERNRALRALEEVEKLARNVVTTFDNSPKRRPIFNVELSNTFIPTDSYNTYWTNEGFDSLDSPDPEMVELVREGRPQYHATPNSPGYIKYCDDWVEALPAHASYYIDENGKLVPYTVRAIMKGLYQSYAEPWIENIEWAMQSEHVALARNFLLDRPEYQDRIAGLMVNKKVNKEEAIRILAQELVAESRLTQEDIANVAAIIWISYFNLRPRIQKEAENIGYEADRYAILENLIYSDNSNDNLFAQLRRARMEPAKKATGIVEKLNLQPQAERMRWTTLNKRRDLPMLHVMTTLAPSETTKIQNWIEEAMSLCLVCRNNGLEDEVSRRQRAYADRMRAIMRRLSEELALDPDKPEERAKLNDEAAKLYHLLEMERPVANPANDPADVSDIQEVQQYLDMHPELLQAAESFVVKELSVLGTSDYIKRQYAVQIKGEALSAARRAYMRENEIRENAKIKERINPNGGKLYIRRDIIAERGLSGQLDDPRYSYTASSELPDWYIGYDPSRVDLGAEIVKSERDTPKICSANHPKALRRSYGIYSLYNIDPKPFPRTSDAEFAKVQENFITRGGVYYLSLGAGIILDGLGKGDWIDYMETSTERGDRMPLPTGSGYRGFCVPKEWCLMVDVIKLAADPKTRDKMFDEWGIDKNKELRQAISDDFQKVLNSLPLYATEEEVIKAAREILSDKSRKYVQIAERNGVTAVYIARLPELLQLMAKTGIIQNEWIEDVRRYSIGIADWTNDRLMGLEQINRIGPFRKMLKMYEGLKYRWYNDTELQKQWGVTDSDTIEQRTEKFRNWMRAIIVVGCPPYKEGTQDYRFSGFAAFLELSSGLYYHTMEYLDPEARVLLENMVIDMFGSVCAPTFAGVTMVGPVGWDGIAGNMPDITELFSKYAGMAMAGIKEFLNSGAITDESEQDKWIDRNARIHGLDFSSWEWELAFPDLSPGKRQETVNAIYDKVSLQLIYLVFGASYNEIADSVRAMLINAGIGAKAGDPKDAIRAYCIEYKGDLRLWPEIKEMLASREPDEKLKGEALIKAIGPAINMLAAREEDVHTRNEMQRMVTRADVVDLGIPETELLDLLISEQLPFTLAEMRRLQGDPTFLFVDGTAGARFPFAETHDPAAKSFVKRLLNLEPNAVYMPMGGGFEDVRIWQQEMEKERAMAKTLFDAVASKDRPAAELALDAIKSYYIGSLETYDSVHQAETARNRKLKSFDAYRYQAEIISKVCSGDIQISDIDFAVFLALGGRYLVDGKYETMEALEQAGNEFNKQVAALAKAVGLNNQPESAANGIGENSYVKWFVGFKPVRGENPFKQVATGVRTSMKDIGEAFGAVAEYFSRVLGLEQKKAMATRKSVFDATAKTIKEEQSQAFTPMRDQARNQLQLINAANGASYIITPEEFGRFLAYTKHAYLNLVRQVFVLPEKDKLREDAEKIIEEVFKGGAITEGEYRMLSKLLGRITERAGGDRGQLEATAEMGELLDIAFAVETCFNKGIFSPNVNPASAWKAVAEFMDKSINNHIYDYWPWHIDKERGAGFEGYTREQKFEIAARIHERWLYPFLRWVVTNKTEMSELTQGYASAILSLGVGGYTSAQRFWFGYARIRDIAVLRAEGNPLPEILDNVSPDVIDADNRMNVVIVYPMGNTTIPFALRRNPQQNKTGVNVISCGFPQIEDGSDGKKYLRVNDAYTWMSKEDYKKALISANLPDEEVQARVAKVDEKKGVVVLLKFNRPITADAVWFHTFNHMRTQIDETEAALIQPFLWEALTHLKAVYREMYVPRGITTPPQREFNMSRDSVMTRFGGNVPAWLDNTGVPMDNVSYDGQMAGVRQAILGLCEETGCTEIIVKPETESGGRGTEIFQIYDDKGELVRDKDGELFIDKAARHGADSLKVDDIVVQAFIRSQVRQAFGADFLDLVSARFASELGIPVDQDTPLFSYWRTILEQGAPEGAAFQAEVDRANAVLPHRAVDGKEYYITHLIGVMSSEGVGNVGRGGRLFMLQGDDEQGKINARYRDDVMWTLREASFRAMHAQRDYLKENWKAILADYLKHHPEFAEDPNVIKLLESETLPDKYLEIPYEMGDYISKWLIDKDGNVVQIYNWDTGEFVNLQELYYENGTVVEPVNGKIKLFDENGARINMYYRNPKNVGFDPQIHLVRAVTCTKMEPNPLAGLWGPHAAREELYGVPADETGCYWIFQLLGMKGAEYKTARQERHTFFADDTVTAGPVVYLAGIQTAPEPNAAKQALNRALKQLNLTSPSRMTESDISILLQQYLVITGKTKFSVKDRALLAGLFEGENLRLVNQALSSDTREYRNYRRRIAEVAEEIKRITNDPRLAGKAGVSFMPGLRIRPDVLSEEQTTTLLDPKNRINLGVVFSGPRTLMQITVARLQQDADKAYEEGKIGIRVNVFGVQKDTLLASQDGSVANVLYAPGEIEAVELNLGKPVRLDWIMPRNLAGEDELAEHRQITDFATRNSIPVSSSIESAVIADDKNQASLEIQQAGIANVEVPEYYVADRGHAELSIEMLSTFIEPQLKSGDAVVTIYIQPASGGTEGRGVKAFSFSVKDNKLEASEDNQRALDGARAHILGLFDLFPEVMIREARGNVFYADENTPAPRRVTFRINAGFNGADTFAETGYAQVAADPDALVTSVEQGGGIEDINVVLHSLLYKDALGKWQRFNPTVEEIRQIKQAAKDVARVVNIKYAGIDFVIEVNPATGRLSTICPLDINARGVLSPSAKILDIEELPVDYRTFGQRMLAPVEFWQMVSASTSANGTGIIDTVIANRTTGQVRSIAAQTRELYQMALKNGFNSNKPASLGIAGGRLRWVLMHPDMSRFFGPALQGVIGGRDADDRSQIEVLIQQTDDGLLHLFTDNPDFQEDQHWIPIEMLEYPAGIDSENTYEAFGMAMAKKILTELGYSDADLANSMRSTISLVANAITSLRTLREGEEGERVQAVFGPDKLKGLQICINGDVPKGGFSSSSAVVVAVLNAFNAYYNLGLSDKMIVKIACQAEYGTGVRAGSLDHAAIQMATVENTILFSSNPADDYRPISHFSMDPNDNILFAFSVPRDTGTPIWSNGVFDPGRVVSGSVRRMTGKSAAIAAILLKLPLDTSFFKEIEEDIVSNGKLNADNLLRVYEVLRALPVLITKEDLARLVNEQKDWYVEQLKTVADMDAGQAVKRADADFTALFDGWDEPVFNRGGGAAMDEKGVPLRAMMAYLYVEVAKNLYLLHNPGQFIDMVSRSQLGDRCFNVNLPVDLGRQQLESRFDWEQGLTGPALMEEWLKRFGATPFDYNKGLDDNSLDAVIGRLKTADPDAVEPDSSLQLYNIEGSNFFRGLALIDLIEAMLKRAFGDSNIAVRINGAGQGDFFQIHIDGRKVDPKEVEDFMGKAVFERFGIDPEQKFVKVHSGGPALGLGFEKLDQMPEMADHLDERVQVNALDSAV